MTFARVPFSAKHLGAFPKKGAGQAQESRRSTGERKENMRMRCVFLNGSGGG
jgi:hypothetical protein